MEIYVVFIVPLKYFHRGFYSQYSMVIAYDNMEELQRNSCNSTIFTVITGTDALANSEDPENVASAHGLLCLPLS